MSFIVWSRNISTVWSSWFIFFGKNSLISRFWREKTSHQSFGTWSALPPVPDCETNHLSLAWNYGEARGVVLERDGLILSDVSLFFVIRNPRRPNAASVGVHSNERQRRRRRRWSRRASRRRSTDTKGQVAPRCVCLCVCGLAAPEDDVMNRPRSMEHRLVALPRPSRVLLFLFFSFFSFLSFFFMCRGGAGGWALMASFESHETKWIFTEFSSEGIFFCKTIVLEIKSGFQVAYWFF